MDLTEKRYKHATYMREWRKDNPEYREYMRKYQLDWYDKYKEKIKAKSRVWSVDNKEQKAQTNKAWYEANKDRTRERMRETAREYHADNPARSAAKTARHRASKALRTPVWADQDAVNFFYECCPVGCDVDHIIPLHGKNISGLHVETNLQWMPTEENQVKSNKFSFE